MCATWPSGILGMPCLASPLPALPRAGGAWWGSLLRLRLVGVHASPGNATVVAHSCACDGSSVSAAGCDNPRAIGGMGSSGTGASLGSISPSSSMSDSPMLGKGVNSGATSIPCSMPCCTWSHADHECGRIQICRSSSHNHVSSRDAAMAVKIRSITDETNGRIRLALPVGAATTAASERRHHTSDNSEAMHL